MVAGMRVGDCGVPKRGSENDDGKEKKDAGNLEPENAAHAAEGAQKAAHAAAHGSTGLDCGAGCRLAGGAVLVRGAGNRSRLMHLGSGGRGLCGNCQALPSHAPGDAHSDA